MKPAFSRVLSYLKYPIALALLALLLSQLDLTALLNILKDADPLLLLAGLGCFTISQIGAVWRMNAYYRWNGRAIDAAYSLKLHYVAMFYNIVLPGGIGGDAYKVYVLKKNAQYPAREGIRIQLITRLNGLLVLIASLIVLGGFLPLPVQDVLLLAAVIAALTALLSLYLLIIPWLLRFPRSQELRAIPYSIWVQGANLLSMICVWLALGGEGESIGYLILFQIAAVAGMIPITVGGLGIREFTFFYGAGLLSSGFGFSLSPEMGVSISLLMFVIALMTALGGFIWIRRIGTMPPCQPIKNAQNEAI